METTYHCFASHTKFWGLGQGFVILVKYNLELEERAREVALISSQRFGNFTRIDMYIVHATNGK